MKIELKNIKHSEFASAETNCFEASVWIDGKRAGTVKNDGQGGPNMYHPWTLENVLNEYAKTLPPVNAFGYEIQDDADTLIHPILTAWLTNKENRRICARRTCFRKPGAQYQLGEWHTYSKNYSPAVAAHLRSKYGADVRILNEELK